MPGGEAYLALAMERLLLPGFRSFRRRPLEARYPPNCDVRGHDLLCPLHVDTRPSIAETNVRNPPQPWEASIDWHSYAV